MLNLTISTLRKKTISCKMVHTHWYLSLALITYDITKLFCSCYFPTFVRIWKGIKNHCWLYIKKAFFSFSITLSPTVISPFFTHTIKVKHTNNSYLFYYYNMHIEKGTQCPPLYQCTCILTEPVVFDGLPKLFKIKHNKIKIQNVMEFFTIKLSNGRKGKCRHFPWLCVCVWPRYTFQALYVHFIQYCRREKQMSSFSLALCVWVASQHYSVFS